MGSQGEKLNCRYSLATVAPLMVFGLIACARITHIPSEENASMGLVKARRVLAATGIKVINNNTLEIARSKFSIPLKGLKVVSGIGDAYDFIELSGPLPAQPRRLKNDNIRPANEVAEAIYVVQRRAEKDGFVQGKSEESQFDETVAAYIASDTKPDLDENTRRLKVQAEDALREKRFEDVADFYGEALAIAPWWPAGHYNRALVLSELKEYPDAIAEMKRYLRLVPEADNARAAKDEMYKWEAKTK